MEFWREKRVRSSNWEPEEKMSLLDLIKERIDIIENKSVDGQALAKKKKAWMEVKEGFEARHQGRGLVRLKEQWKRLKSRSKESIKALKMYQDSVEGDGPLPSNTIFPTKLDLEIERLLSSHNLQNDSLADDDEEEDTLVYIVEDIHNSKEESEAVQPSTSNFMVESIKEPTEHPTETKQIRSTAKEPETPQRSQSKEKQKNSFGHKEIMTMLKIQSAKNEEERRNMKRKREMEEELHALQVGICKRQSELLNVKLAAKKYKLMYWKRKCEDL